MLNIVEFLKKLAICEFCLQEGPAAREGNQAVLGSAIAGKKTGETVGAADALMDALELAAHEAQRMQVTPAPCCCPQLDCSSLNKRWLVGRPSLGC